MEILSASQYFWARLFFERSLAIIYALGFIVALKQFPALLGEKGLLPAPAFIRRTNNKIYPSLFHFYYSDNFLKAVCWIGLILSLGLMLGLSLYLHPLIHMLIWLCLYYFYLSITNIGQIFYGFGWESMLCEAGFFMAFMGPEWMKPSWIPILILRWMLFRTEMGAGLIKLRGDKCWKDLTALFFHHETQPMPNPLSRFFHFLPKIFLKAGVFFSHFVQVIVPIGLFFPQPIAGMAGVLIIFHQLLLIMAGNYAWLNWLTVVLAFLTIPGPYPGIYLEERPFWFEMILYALAVWTVFLSYRPLLNLFSKRQKMNYSWNRYHLVGAYGAFGSVTKKRYELIVEGRIGSGAWLEYEFKAKPGKLNQRPPQMAPYHLRLDWLMWFLPFSVMVEEEKKQIYVLQQEEWFLRFLQKLLENNKSLIKLIQHNPFPASPPDEIRVSYYLYHFTSSSEFKNSGNYWKRTLIGEYLPPLQREDFL